MEGRDLNGLKGEEGVRKGWKEVEGRGVNG